MNKVIGVDIGGTKMAVASVDSDARIRYRLVLPTESDDGFDRAVERLGDAIHLVIVKSGWAQDELAGIGIGCAGPVDPIRGLINNPHTLSGWNQCNIVTPLRERFNVPVFLENDADAAAFGESTHGAGRGFDPIVVLTFGTGVGGGIVMQGRIYRGANGAHPEIGHISVCPDGPECYCGGCGCLESVASGSAIGARGLAAGFRDARAVFAGAQGGDACARAIVSRAAEATAAAAWTLCHAFLPTRIILGGGIMDEHFDLFASATRCRLERATQFSPVPSLIVRAALGNDAGIIGAAALAVRQIFPAHRDPASALNVNHSAVP